MADELTIDERTIKQFFADQRRQIEDDTLLSRPEKDEQLRQITAIESLVSDGLRLRRMEGAGVRAIFQVAPNEGAMKGLWIDVSKDTYDASDRSETYSRRIVYASLPPPPERAATQIRCADRASLSGRMGGIRRRQEHRVPDPDYCGSLRRRL
jgi:hypothetical protein